jgi:membrane protein required for colicin V production
MFDLILLGIIGISALLGLLRGFVGIVVGAASWLLSGWAAFQFGDSAGRWLAEGGPLRASHLLGGYALVFVSVMVLVMLIGLVARSALESMRMSGADRSLGFALGAVRGVFFAAVLVVLASFTPLPREPVWQQSAILPMLSPVASWMRSQLPDLSMPQMPRLPGLDELGALGGMDLGAMSQMGVGKMPQAGDNAALNDSALGSGMQEMVRQALGVKPGQQAPAAQTDQDPSRVLPANIDPAQVRPTNDPARVDAQGR